MGFQIKKLIGFGLVGGMVLKKFGSMLFNIPRQLLRTTFKIQKAIVYFPLRLINTFYRLLCRLTIPPNITCNCTKTLKETSKRESSKIESPHKKSVLKIIELEPVFSYHKYGQLNGDQEFDSPCHKAIQVMLGLRQESPRKSATTNQCLQPKFIKTAESVNKDNEDDHFVMPEFPKGADYIRYSEIMTRKALKVIDDLSNFAKSRRSCDEPSYKCSCKKERLVQESTLNGIESLFNKFIQDNSEHTKSVKCRYRKEKLNQTCNLNGKINLTEAVPAIKVIRELDCQEKSSDIRNISQNSTHAKMNGWCRTTLSQNASGTEDTLLNAQQILNLSSDVLRGLIDIITQEIISLKQRIGSTTGKIEEVFKSSIILFEELSEINERFNRLITLSNTIMDLQRKLNERHKKFQEVEADRNDMLQKLQALDRMIKEEEDFLRDVSRESSQISNSSNPTSPFRHVYL